MSPAVSKYLCEPLEGRRNFGIIGPHPAETVILATN